MSVSKEELKVVIRHGETQAEFEGGYQQVWASVNRYLSQIYPALEAVKKLVGAVDVQKLAERLVGLVEIRDGRIMVLKELDAKRKILLCIAAAYVGKALGLLEKDKLAPKEVAAYSGLNERVVRARLSELRRAGLVVKHEEGLYSFTPASLREIFGEEV